MSAAAGRVEGRRHDSAAGIFAATGIFIPVPPRCSAKNAELFDLANKYPVCRCVRDSPRGARDHVSRPRKPGHLVAFLNGNRIDAAAMP
jgi:hypothetical protein